MFWRVSSFCAVALCAAMALAGGKVRTWTSADGRTMQAEFVSELDGDVTFLKDGKLIVIRAEKLSKQDQQDIKDLAAGKEPGKSPEQDPFSTPTAGGTIPGKVRAVDEGSADSEKPKKPIAIQTRTWTDRFGLKSSGKFVRVDGNDVVLSRGARVITVPFANLSDDDQDYVRNLLISQGKEADIPTENTGTGGAGAGSNLPGGDNGFPAAGRGGIAGPGMPGVPGGIGGMPPGMAPGAGGMPPGAFPPGGMGGMGRGGPRGGPGMGGGIGMPPGMAPPGIGGPGMPGSGPMMGPAGIGGKMGGPMGPGFPGSGFPGSDPAGGSLGSSDRMPGMGMPPPGATPGMMPGSPDLAGSGLDSFPRGRLPAMEPASIPSIPSPTFPSMEIEEYFQCSKCNARLTKLEAAGSSCPRCNATWGFKQDQFGRKTMTAAGSGQMATVGVVIVIFVLVGMAVFIAVFIGIIVAIVKAASAPARPPQPMPQQRYY